MILQERPWAVSALVQRDAGVGHYRITGLPKLHVRGCLRDA
jgi:hypothetical protein